MSAWQPIETAPKDGTKVLLCRDNRISIGYWTDCYEDYWWYSDDRLFIDGAEPTHWMPLPAPPEVTK